MKTERLMQNGILNTGEPRHYSSWEMPALPRLQTRYPESGRQRQNRKSRPPVVRPIRTGWGSLQALWQAFKLG
jgi:hypothetical protein